MKRELGLFLLFCFLITTFTGCTGDSSGTTVKAATGSRKETDEKSKALDKTKLPKEELAKLEVEERSAREIHAFLKMGDQIFSQTWAKLHPEAKEKVSNVFKSVSEKMARIYETNGAKLQKDEKACRRRQGYELLERGPNTFELRHGDCAESIDSLARFMKANNGVWNVSFFANQFPRELGNALSFLNESVKCEFLVNDKNSVEMLSCSGVGQDSPTEKEPGQYIEFVEMNFVRSNSKPLTLKAMKYKGVTAGFKVPVGTIMIVDVPGENLLKITEDVALEEKPKEEVKPTNVPNSQPAAPISKPEEPQPGNNNGSGNNNGLGNNNGDPMMKTSSPNARKVEGSRSAAAQLDENGEAVQEEILAGQQGDGG